MVWVIEQLIAGEWQHVREPNGLPIMRTYKRDAEREMFRLKNNNRQILFRLQHIKD